MTLKLPNNDALVQFSTLNRHIKYTRLPLSSSWKYY